MFLFEDREQYINARKDLHGKKEEDISSEAAVTVTKAGSPFALSDMFVPTEDNFSNYSQSFEKIDYLTLSHEFVHCIQNMAGNIGGNLSKPVYEGSAEAIACEALRGEEDVHTRCSELKLQGLNTIKSNNYTIADVFFDRDEPGLSKAVNNPYTTGMAMLTFLHERHPEAIKMISEYHLDSSRSVTDLSKKMSCINNSGEFTKWVDDSLSVDKNGTKIVRFLNERHPEVVEQLSEWVLNHNMEKFIAFGNKTIAINCSGEFQNWINDQQHHSTDNII